MEKLILLVVLSVGQFVFAQDNALPFVYNATLGNMTVKSISRLQQEEIRIELVDEMAIRGKTKVKTDFTVMVCRHNVKAMAVPVGTLEIARVKGLTVRVEVQVADKNIVGNLSETRLCLTDASIESGSFKTNMAE